MGEPSQGGARRSPPKGFELRRKADVHSALRREGKKKQRHSRGEMRSEHNGGASLAAFLLAVSTMTLLFVSPVEGQLLDPCVVTAFPGEPGSCPALGNGEPLFCYERPPPPAGDCHECFFDTVSECEDFFFTPPPGFAPRLSRSNSKLSTQLL